MVAPDDVVQVRFQSFTEDGREDLAADVQDADTSVIPNQSLTYDSVAHILTVIWWMCSQVLSSPNLKSSQAYCPAQRFCYFSILDSCTDFSNGWLPRSLGCHRWVSIHSCIGCSYSFSVQCVLEILAQAFHSYLSTEQEIVGFISAWECSLLSRVAGIVDSAVKLPRVFGIPISLEVFD